MIFHVLTLFPDMIRDTLNHSILKRAQQSNIIDVNCVNIRDFSTSKHKKVDDYPYGGGAGMLMQPDPVYKAYKSVMENINEKVRVIYLSPQGSTFTQEIAKELSLEKNIILLCGHYEGIDQRVIDEIVTDEISIGDYILTGGELPALVLIDSVSRLVQGVLNKAESYEDESFSNNLLEYSQYTRPPIFLNRKVPEVLLSGHHENIKKWRNENSLLNTIKKRPDLIKED